MNDNDFGRTLRKMRIDSGKTVPEVSEHLMSLGYKAATQTIYGWERGLSQPNPDPFLAMCRFYGVTDIFSYFGDDPMGEKPAPTDGGGHEELCQDIEIAFGEGSYGILQDYFSMNEAGKTEARKQVHLLTFVPDYKRQEEGLKNA